MERLPELSGLNHAEKDRIIDTLWGLVSELRRGVAELSDRVGSLEAENTELRDRAGSLEAENTKLRGQAAKDSSNSSKPPSSDGPCRKTGSLRKKSGRPAGGIPGHRGHHLKRSDRPDRIIDHEPPSRCDSCGDLLQAESCEARQVFELPPIELEVTEHRAWSARCSCGHWHRAEFPDHVRAAAQYGPRFKAFAVHLHHHHMLPAQRATEILESLCGVRPSTGTLMNFVKEASEFLEPTWKRIGEALLQSPALGADESGMRAGGRQWMHMLVSESLSWLGVHPKRGQDAFREFGLLPEFHGTLVHDGFKSYESLGCGHARCNAHHLRELKFEAEHNQQSWATQMSKLLCRALEDTHNHSEGLPAEKTASIRTEYDALIDEGWSLNPPAPPDGWPGKTPQTSTVNLLRRLDQHADEVLRFTQDPRVPFSNNDAEREVRMPKLKLKIAGTFRTGEGARRFCILRSYFSSLKKQRQDLLSCFEAVFSGHDPTPALAL